MLKRLTEEKQAEILEAGIAEFAARGPDKASMSAIAKQAGISVGVLYKYYKNKDGFFMACLRRSIAALEDVIEQTLAQDDKILSLGQRMLRAVQHHARAHGDYVRMYQAITTGAYPYTPRLAAEIEGVTARLYPQFLKEAQEKGSIRTDVDPRLFAFFLDNLLMMMQFSYSCDYYKARFQMYCGVDILDEDERVLEELSKFLESAFTLEQSQIAHKSEGDL